MRIFNSSLLAMALVLPQLANAGDVDYGRQIGKLCPGQVPPEIPPEAISQNISGTIVARARVVEGVITEVTIISGPDIYREPVINAMKRYRCDPKAESGVVMQTFDFRPQGR